LALPNHETKDNNYSQNDTSKIDPGMDKIEELVLKGRKIAHDLNNLLTSILGNTQLAYLSMSSNEDLERFLGSIEDATLCAAKELSEYHDYLRSISDRM